MSHPPRIAESAGALARGFNEFALRLFQRLAVGATNSNIFVSPFGIAAALLTLYEGAAGETRRALAETLSLDAAGIGDHAEAYAALLASVGDDSSAGDEVFVAISLWVREGIGLRPDFLSVAHRRLGATTSALNPDAATATREINAWVREKTGGRIDEIIEPETLDVATLLVLLSAVYFKGVWKTRFDESRTRAGEFSTWDGRKSLPMMSQSGTFKYSEGARLRAVELPYRDDRRSMLIFLPTDGAAFGEFLSNLSPRAWRQHLATMHETTGEVVLPRFDLCYETRLEETLNHLGAARALRPGADFSALCDGPAFVSEVRHKATVSVTEEGTVAAAVTSVIVSRSRLRGFRFVVDRPFFCVIKENTTDVILFAGAITNP